MADDRLTDHVDHVTVISAARLNWLRNHTIPIFSDSTARDLAVSAGGMGTPSEEGVFCYCDGQLQWWDGSAWLGVEAQDLFGAWTSVAPAFTNLSIGNGTPAGRMNQVGKTVTYIGQLTFGSTTSISGNVALTLPVTINPSCPGALGTVLCQDASVGTNRQTGAVNDAGTMYAGGQIIAAAVPFTWATGDILRWGITYEAA